MRVRILLPLPVRPEALQGAPGLFFFPGFGIRTLTTPWKTPEPKSSGVPFVLSRPVHAAHEEGQAGVAGDGEEEGAVQGEVHLVLRVRAVGGQGVLRPRPDDERRHREHHPRAHLLLRIGRVRARVREQRHGVGNADRRERRPRGHVHPDVLLHGGLGRCRPRGACERVHVGGEHRRRLYDQVLPG